MMRCLRVLCVAAFLTPLLVAAPPQVVADRLAWFRQAKFGMFVHWGPYSALAGEWKGRHVPAGANAEWIMKRFEIPADDYREAARRFLPDRFDARALARLARDSGMKYLVYTAKHHDGFAMYHSRVSAYNIYEWGGFKRDPLAELAAACREEGVRLCVYYSQREDWDDADAYGNDWDFHESAKNFERYLERKSKPQLRELLTRYGPISMIWFDRGLYTAEQAEDIRKLVRSLQPDCLVNGRLSNYDQDLIGDFLDMSDNGMPDGGLDELWETPQTLNGTWGYSRFDNRWKSSATVIRRLVEVASRGGNYLLNIGPDGSGAVPAASEKVLRETGLWLSRNGESVYGTEASPFGDASWGTSTVKGSRLYLHVFNWPAGGVLRLPGLKNAVVRAYLLADPQQRPLRAASGAGLALILPAAAPDAVDSVVVLELKGAPRGQPQVVVPTPDGKLLFDYLTASTFGHAAKTFNRKGGFYIGHWSAPADRASWKAHVPAAGRYRVRLTYAARPGWQDGQIELLAGAGKRVVPVQITGDWYEYRSVDAGVVRFDQAGEHAVTVRPALALSHTLVQLKSIEMIPVDDVSAAGQRRATKNIVPNK